MSRFNWLVIGFAVVVLLPPSGLASQPEPNSLAHHNMRSGEEPASTASASGQAFGGYSEQTLEMLNGSTFRGNPNFPSGQHPESVAADPVIGRIFALSLGSYWLNGTLDVLDAASNRLIVEVPLGISPVSVNIDPALGVVVGGNNGSGALTIVNASTDRVTSTIPIGCFLIGMALDPGRHVEYVRCQSVNLNGLVAVVNLTRGVVVARVPAGWDSAGLALDSANGNLYVVNRESSNVSVISGANYTVLASVRVPDLPEAVAVDAAYDRVYVLSDLYSANLTVLNGTNNSILSTVRIPTPYQDGSNDPGFVAVDSATSQVFVGMDSESTVTVISAANNTILGNVPVGLGPTSVGFDPTIGLAVVLSPGSSNLSFIATSALRVVGTLGSGASPAPMAVDLQLDRVYLVDDYRDSVEVVNATGHHYDANVSVGVRPSGIIFDPFDGDLYVTEPDAGLVSVLNGSTYGQIGAIYVGTGASKLTLCESIDRVYVAGSDEQTVTAINATTNAVVATDSFDSPAASIACDPVSGDVFVGSAYYGEVLVLNGSSAAPVATIHIPRSWGGVPSLVVDSTNGEVYGVSYSDATTFFAINSTTLRLDTNLSLGGVGGFPIFSVYDSVTQAVWLVAGGNWSLVEISAANGTLLRVIPLGPEVSPVGLDVDSSTGQILLLSEGLGGGTATFLNGSSGRALASVAVGWDPWWDVFDLANDLALIGNHGSDNISIIDLATYQLVGSAPSGAGLHGLAIDPLGHSILAANPDQGTVSILGPPGPYPIRFSEEGLPTGAPWDATLDGMVLASKDSSAVFGVENGTHHYSLTAGTAFAADPSAGNATVSGSGVNLSIRFTTLYPITLTEGGLPPATDWAVTLNGSTVSTTGTTLGFEEPNGSYTFRVGPVPGWRPTVLGGTIRINGSGARVHIGWQAPTYLIEVSESGLPRGTSWSVTVGTTTQNSSAPSIPFWLPNGNYSYSVSAVSASGYAISETSAWGGIGHFEVLGANATIGPIRYVRPVPSSFSITFGETGLAANTSWSVQIGGQMLSSKSAQLGALEPNGSYWFTVSQLPSYNSTPRSGWVNISGTFAYITVAFTGIAPLRIETPEAVPSVFVLGNQGALVVNVRGGFPPYAYAYQGLPEGCPSANESTLLCTPESAGNYSVTVRVTDALGTNATVSVRINVQAPASAVGAGRAAGWPEPATLLASGVAAAGVLAAAAAVWRSRSRRVPPPT